MKGFPGRRLTRDELDALRDADALAAETGEGAVYGQLIVLGYKEYRVEGSTWHPVGARNEKFALRRRAHANGIRRDAVYLSSAPPEKGSGKYRSAAASHSVTMSVAAGARGADGRPVARPQCVRVFHAFRSTPRGAHGPSGCLATCTVAEPPSAQKQHVVP